MFWGVSHMREDQGLGDKASRLGERFSLKRDCWSLGKRTKSQL